MKSRDLRPVIRPRPGLPEEDLMPDVRDGLSRVERIVLHTLHELQKERAATSLHGIPAEDQTIPTTMLYGRVVEKIDLSVAELQAVLGKLTGRGRS